MLRSAEFLLGGALLVAVACGPTTRDHRAGGGGAGGKRGAPIAAGTPVRLAAAADPELLTVDDGHVWWVAGGDRIERVPHGGGDVQVVARIGPDDGIVSAFTLHGDQVYWCVSEGRCSRQAKVGGEATIVVEDQDGPVQLAIEGDGLYWVDAGTGELRRMPLAGGAIDTLASGLSYEAPLVIHRGDAYGLEFTQGQVWRVSRSEDRPVPIVDGQYGPVDIVVGDDDRLYWTNSGGRGLGDGRGGAHVEVAAEAGSIASVPARGGTAMELLSNLDNPTALAIDGDTLYFASFGRVVSAPRDGGSQIELVAQEERVLELAVGTSGLYWISADGAIWALRR